MVNDDKRMVPRFLDGLALWNHIWEFDLWVLDVLIMPIFHT